MSTPATVVISETNGVAGSGVTTNAISTLSFGNADIVNMVSATYPVVIPASGLFAGSMQKWERAYVSSMGTSNQITDIKLWMSVANCITNGTGLTVAPYYGVFASPTQVNEGDGANSYISAFQTPTNSTSFSFTGMSGGSPTTFTGNATAGGAQCFASIPTGNFVPSVNIGNLHNGTIGTSASSPTLVAPNYSNYFVMQCCCYSSVTPYFSASGSGKQNVYTIQYDES
jgi:hypothetical protein